MFAHPIIQRDVNRREETFITEWIFCKTNLANANKLQKEKVH